MAQNRQSLHRKRGASEKPLSIYFKILREMYGHGAGPATAAAWLKRLIAKSPGDAFILSARKWKPGLRRPATSSNNPRPREDSGMTDGGSNSVALVAPLDFSAATELASELRGLRQEPVTLDASDVRHLGAPCIQVLLSAGRTWHEDAVSFSVENHSSAFSEGLARMGIAASELSHPGGRS